MAFDPSTARLTGFALDDGAQEKPAEKPTGVRATDYLKQGAGGAVSASGNLLRSFGDAVNAAGETAANFVRGVKGEQAKGRVTSRERLFGADAIVNAGRAVSGAGDRIKETISEGGKAAIAGSTPEGDIFKPSTLSFGKDPSLSGYALQGMDVIGQILPVAASAIATRGKMAPTAAVSGGLGGGAAAEQEQARIEQMSQADLDKLPGYQALRARGMNAADARAELTAKSSQSAFLSTAPVSALSAFTEGLPLTQAGQRAIANVAGPSRSARALTGAVGGALGEGVQEVLEQGAQTTGANRATGEDRSLTDDSFANFTLGAIGGGAIGGAGGLISSNEAKVPGAGTQPADVAPPAQAPAAAAPAQDPMATMPNSPTDGLTGPAATPETGAAPGAGEAPESGGAPEAGAVEGEEAPQIHRYEPANTAIENGDGTVQVKPGVSINPAAGALSNAVVVGAREGAYDHGATITAPDGSVVDPSTGEMLRAPPRAVDADGNDLDPGAELPSKPKERRPLEPGELDELVMERLAVNPMMDARQTGMLPRTLGVSLADVSNSKKRVRRAIEDEKAELAKRGVTGAAADAAALGRSNDQPENRNEAQEQEPQPGQPLNADAGIAASRDGRNEGADGSEAEAARVAQAANPVEHAAAASTGDGARAGDRGNAVDAVGQAGNRPAEGAPGGESAGQGQGQEGTAAPAAGQGRVEAGVDDVSGLAKALKRTDRATGPDGATYMVKANANGEGYYVTRTEDSSTRQHRTPNPAQPWTREQAVQAALNLAQAPKESTNAQESTVDETAPPVREEPATAQPSTVDAEASAPAPDGDAGVPQVQVQRGGLRADRDRLTDEAAWNELASPSVRRAVLAEAKARKGLSPQVMFKNLNEREKAAVGEAARAAIEKENAERGPAKADTDNVAMSASPEYAASLPSISKNGSPLAELKVSKDADGKFRAAYGYLTSTSGSGSSFNHSPAFDTIEEARAHGLDRLERDLPKNPEKVESDRVQKVRDFIARERGKGGADAPAKPGKKAAKPARSEGSDAPAAVTVAKAGEGATAIVLDPSALAAKPGTSQAPAARTPPKVSANKLFTEDAATKARELIRKKLGQLNAGIDPELLSAGITLAGYHIEKGARTFSAYAKAMVDDLGDYVKPHLASWYEAARRYPGMEEAAKDMTPTVEVDASHAAGIPELNTKEAPHAERPVLETVDEGGSAPALADAPAEDVRPAQEQREAGVVADGSGESDARGNGRPDRQGEDDAGRSVARGSRRVDRAEPVDLRQVEDAADASIEKHEVLVQQPGGQHPRNFVITPDFPLGEGGAKTKAANNLEAIRTLKRIEAEGRAATPAEQDVLARYVGWGGIPQAFKNLDGDKITKGWERVVAAVEKEMTTAELDAARRSTQDAHYTSREVIGGMYDALAHLGYSGGVTLEPSVGTGNFIGMAPASIRGAQRWKGIELDSITGRIAQQLYPEAGVVAGRGFQEVDIPANYFDAVVGNPPFGRTTIYDANHKDISGFSIHNFFFAKSVKSLKPGGLLSMVVSSSMLDKAGGKQRRWLANHTRFLGAIRLPNNAFKANAGTEVTTDIVFLQKLYPGEKATDTSWTEIGAVNDPAGGEAIPLNRYFVQHPEMMLGTMTREGSMRRANEPTLSPNGRDLAEQLREAIALLPKDVAQTVEPVVDADSVPGAGTGANVAPYAYYSKGGKIHQRLPDVMDEFRDRELDISDRDAERVRAMISLRDQLKALMRAEMQDAPRGQIEGMRTKLNGAYDSFRKEFGYINSQYNTNLFRDDPDAYRLRAIERNYQKLDRIDAESRGIAIEKGRSTTEVAEKATILERRVFTKAPTPKAETAADAIVVSLNTFGRLNLPEMSRLLGKSEAQVLAELGDKVFMDPKDGHVTADEYLSGNVKAKLKQARAAAQEDPAFDRNVRALEDVQPADISPADIYVSMGAPWVTGNDYAQFAREVIGIGDMRANLNPLMQKFELGGYQAGAERFGTRGASARKVFERAVNRMDPTVFATDAEGKRHVDGEATEAMRAAIDLMREEFGEWVWKDQARRDRLSRLYNDTYNTDRSRAYDGSFMTLPGKVDDDIIRLRPSQMNGVWRMIQDGKMLADHVVGAGKTYTAIAAAMQMKRMGLAKKSMFAVPNHLVQQWAGDWMRLYPNANILAVTENDFTKDRRKLTFSRIATGDWDAVIVAHSQFTRISPPEDFMRQYKLEKLAEIEEARANAKASQDRGTLRDLDSMEDRLLGVKGKKGMSVKQREQLRDQAREKLNSRLDNIERDTDTAAFDEMGIDNLYVDEAHEFKNLGFATKKRNVSGMGSAANGGSQRAEDLFIKTRYLNSVNKGRGLFFLTGTPVSNSLAEMFTMQRYMAFDDMKARGIHLFDLWANTFAQESTSFELDSSGRGLKAKTVLSKFLNVPEMMQLYTRFADTVTLADLKEMTKAAGGVWPVPKIKGGKAQNFVVPGGAPLMAYIENNIIPRMEAVSGERGQKPDPSVDNMLKITNDARLAALDVRLRDPLAPDDPQSKPNLAVREAMRIYKKWDEQKGAQLIFCDLSTPKASVAKERARIEELQRLAEEGDEAAQGKLDAMSPDEILAISAQFSVYDDVKAKLIAAGVPAREIAFVHDANTDLQKKSLFDKVNRGEVRFLLGSTSKMGAGTNVQRKLVALHHLDAPWRPSDLEQREGRIVRQGNEFYEADPDGFEIEINRYATERTYDARMWQLIERKAGIVEQIRKGDPSVREVDDVAGESANAAEMKAAATGNPLIIEQVELQAKVKRLSSLKRAFDGRRYDAESEVARINADGGPEGARDRDLARAEIGERVLEENPRDPFTVDVGTKTYEKFKEGADALAMKVVDAIGDIERAGGKKEIPLGTFRGAEMAIRRVFGGYEVIGVTYPDEALGKIGEAMDIMSRDGAVSGSGILTKVNNIINEMGQWREKADIMFRRRTHRLNEMNDVLAQPFRQGDELAQAQVRLKDVMAQLVADSKKPAVEKQAPRVQEASEGETDFDLGDDGMIDLDEADFDMTGYQPMTLGTAGARAIYAAIERIAAPLRTTGVDVRVIDNGHGFPDVVKARVGAKRVFGARGLVMRSKDGKTARVFINAAQVGTITQAKRTLMHEIVGHWGMERLLGDQFAAVAKDALRIVRTDPRLESIRVRVSKYKDFGETTMAKEALAMMAEADIKTGVMARVYAAIRRLLRSVGLGDVHLSHDEIRVLAQQAARGLVGEVGSRAGSRQASTFARGLRSNPFAFDFDLGPDEGIADVPADTVNAAIANASRWRVADIAQSAVDKIADWKGELLGSLTLHQLADVAKPYLPEVAGYDDIVRKMGARRNELMGQSDELAKRWQTWQGKNREEAAKLADVMHDATLAGVDPAAKFVPGYVVLASGETVPMTQDAVSKILPELEARADRAPAHIATLIRMDAQRIRDTLAQEGARVGAYPDLKARFDAMSPEARAIYVDVRDTYGKRADAMQAALVKRISGLEVSDVEKKALTDRVRAHFESARVQAPYFPLARFGNYWVSAKKGDETVFKMTETAAQQRRVAAAFKAQGYATTAGMKIDMARAIDGASGSFMSNVVETLAKAGVDKEVSDEIYQLYLRTLPDLSTRKNFIHRKGTPGYDADALRAFAGQMFHGAHQLARLEYSQEAEQAQSAIAARARELGEGDDTDKANAAARMANEMKKRHEWVMSPKDAGWVQKLSSANFAFYLGASPAAAMVNLTQTYVMTFPALASRHGWVKAFTEINRAMGQTISTYGNVDTKLAGDELLAMKELDRLGARDKTLTHDLAGLAEGTTTNYSPGWRKTMEVISHLFHKAEVFNREASGLAAYRMARSAGENHEAAVRYAADTIFQTHGDYANANRARWIQSNAAKVIFAFKQYSQMMTYNLWRNFYQAAKGLTPQERSEARKKLAGTIGVTALLSGAMGMPLLSVAFAIANAANALWGDDDEPWDAETEFHNFLVEHLGSGFGRVAAYGPTQVLTGAAIADRTSLNELWFRDPDQELEGRALADYWLEQIAGPIAGTWLINPLTAAKLWGEGNIGRAIETILPKALKDGLKTIRFATQGVNNMGGQPIVNDLSPYEFAMQAAGFSPARVAEQYKINNALKGYEKQIEDRRKALLNAYTMAVSLNDAEAVRASAVKIAAFNKAHPTFPINAGSIRRSLIQRRKMADSMVNGILLNRKLDKSVRERVAFDDDEGGEDE